MSNKKKHSLPCIDVDGDAIYQEPNFTGSPERNLLMAMLERAILDYVGNETKESLKAEEWLFGETFNENSKFKTQFEHFSFAWVCHELDLDPFHISNIIKSMPKRGNRRVAPWYFENHAQSA